MARTATAETNDQEDSGLARRLQKKSASRLAPERLVRAITSTVRPHRTPRGISEYGYEANQDDRKHRAGPQGGSRKGFGNGTFPHARRRHGRRGPDDQDPEPHRREAGGSVGGDLPVRREQLRARERAVEDRDRRVEDRRQARRQGRIRPQGAVVERQGRPQEVDVDGRLEEGRRGRRLRAGRERLQDVQHLRPRA